ncbi:MAG TPA: DUF6445 family protein [Thermoanaerobaculia bacterium]|nr:DUF6445 family protein [Thermoanaerobaculia bacterium]
MTDAALLKALSRLEVSPHPLVQVHSIASPGDMVVVDGVYRDWTAVRDLALQQEFTRDRSEYPGKRALLQAHIPGLDRLIARVLCPGHLIQLEQEVTFSQLDALRDFRPEQHVPHRDGKVQVGGLIFLTEADAFGGGTGFFRHRSTGLLGVFLGDPDLVQAARRGGYPGVDAMLVEIVRPSPTASIYNDTPSDAWELVHLVELRANRLLLFDARLFHAPMLDSRPDRGMRLTQNLFLRVVPEAPRIRFRPLPR